MNPDAFTTALDRFVLELEAQSESTQEAEDRPLYNKFIAKTAIILAKVRQDKPTGDDVAEMERLFGHTWFKDKEAYTKIYSEWDTFKELLKRSIHGMTVNERLFNLGLMDDFDDAVIKGDEFLLRGVLFKCFLGDENVEAIISQELKKNK